MNNIHGIILQISYVLVIIGALSWGIIGLFGIDFIARLFGAGTPGTRVIYILIGIAAIFMLIG